MDTNPLDPEMLRDCIDNLNSASKKADERDQHTDQEREEIEFMDWAASSTLNGHTSRRTMSIGMNLGPTERE